MIEDVRRLLDDYIAWLRDRTKLREINGDWVEITTPYLDRNNDYIQIYARRETRGYLLTDGGQTILDLEQSGCGLDTPKRQDLLNMSLRGFGVNLADKAIEVHADDNSFALRKHNLVQAILAVNDLFYLASPIVASLFYEDVVAWLELSEIRFTPRVKFTGKTGYDHLFDFVIPKSRHQPERIIRAINRPDRNAAEVMAFAWYDTREVRPPKSRAYAILNDREQKVPFSVLGALRNYEVKPILWNEREDVREELVA